MTVNEHTRTVIPIDVTSILGYGKRDVSRYPILLQARLLTGSGHQSLQERAGAHPLLAAHSSNYDFVGAYDFSRQAGNQRVADHRISPGENLALDGFDSVSGYERVLAGCDS